MSEETKARDEICRVGASIFQRGLTFGSTGNISVRLPDGGYLMTPTNASLGALDPAKLSRFDATGRFLDGDPGTKEAFLHFCMYGQSRDAGAVVHLHSTHSVAVSILAYFPPGDEALAKAVEKLAGRHHAVLLANHGPVVAGSSLANAQFATEELEETARLFLMLRSMPIRPLTPQQVDALRQRYNLY
jgi:ribulose-5-phosphate 4-epimerase/fuculose-1-phosphate aldolase